MSQDFTPPERRNNPTTIIIIIGTISGQETSTLSQKITDLSSVPFLRPWLLNMHPIEANKGTLLPKPTHRMQKSLPIPSDDSTTPLSSTTSWIAASLHSNYAVNVEKYHTNQEKSFILKKFHFQDVTPPPPTRTTAMTTTPSSSSSLSWSVVPSTLLIFFKITHLVHHRYVSAYDTRLASIG